MSQQLPQFDSPPVVETVLGVQFEQIPDFSPAHVGIFWERYLDERWTRSEAVPPLEEVSYQETLQFSPRSDLRFGPFEPDRIRLTNSDDDRMLQIQNRWFIYNWRFRGESYPSYDVLRPEFDDYLEKFKHFLGSEKLGELKPNLWEVTYVNQLPKGDLWQSPKDWESILPGCFLPFGSASSATIESIHAKASMQLVNGKGRLSIVVKHSQAKSDKREVLDLRFTARGPIDSSQSLGVGLENGRAAIVNCFTEVTSDTAHKHWRRKR